MFGLLPKNLEFFDCFDEAAETAVQCAKLLADFSRQANHVDYQRVAAITEAEHNCDKITHRTLERLEKSYITPIDRDDIHRLITRIDDVVDSTEAIAQRMMCYKIAETTQAFQSQCDILVKAAQSMSAAVAGLRTMKDRGKKRDGLTIEQLIIAVHAAEEEGDAIHHKFLAELFEQGLDAFQVIKLKELHELVEQAIDYCDDVACMVHGIVLKNM